MPYDYVRERFENHLPKSGFTLPEMNQFLRGLLPLMHNARVGELRESFFDIPKSADTYAEAHNTTPEKARALFLETPNVYIAHHAVPFFKLPQEKQFGWKGKAETQIAPAEETTPPKPQAKPQTQKPNREAIRQHMPVRGDRDIVHAFQLVTALVGAAQNGKPVTSLRGRLSGMKHTVSEIGYALKHGHVVEMDRVFPHLSPNELPKTMTDFGLATGLYERDGTKVIAAPPEKIQSALARLTA